jgi:hypothetical protein
MFPDKIHKSFVIITMNKQTAVGIINYISFSLNVINSLIEVNISWIQISMLNKLRRRGSSYD